MNNQSTLDDQQQQKMFRNFIEREITPYAGEHDREERISSDLIKKLGTVGYLGATVPKEFGGMGMDLLTFGRLNEELGRACTSVRSLITVQTMVTQVIERWSDETQKARWLNRLALGETIGAFALTEPDFGSDARNIQTEVVVAKDEFIINGCKKWTSFGQIADLFLVLGQCDGKHCAILIEKDTPGFSIKPLSGILGARGTMLAELNLKQCRIPQSNLLGGMGFGLHAVAFTALDIGRYSIAWGCVGLAQACLEASAQYAKTRRQFDAYISEHQLIQKMMADMLVDIKASRLLCEQAGRLKQSGDQNSFKEMMVAKYYAAKMAVRVTNKAVQIHGANGYTEDYPVERYLRDAKIMETVEGSNQILQMMIGKYALQEYGLEHKHEL